MKITTTDRKRADAVFLKYLIYVTTTKTKTNGFSSKEISGGSLNAILTTHKMMIRIQRNLIVKF